jgi:tRNA threonylcarbamoyl adenosine modification protein YeaZ
MNLILGISTSSSQFKIVFGENSKVLYSSNHVDDTKNIALLVANGIAELGISPQQIKSIIVDIGPGGTSLVRTGVAYANGLAYSLGIPVSPVLSLELLGMEAWDTFQLPVICTSKSIKDNAYVALFAGKLLKTKYGTLKNVVEDMVADIDEFVVAGSHRAQLIELFKNKKVHDSTFQNGNALLLIEKQALFSDKKVSFPNFVLPLTEQSPIFI